MLSGYKRSSNETVRSRHRMQVAATLHRFFHDHRQCIERAAGGGWHAVTIVPSKTPRDDPHPLELAIRMLGARLTAE